MSHKVDTVNELLNSIINLCESSTVGEINDAQFNDGINNAKAALQALVEEALDTVIGEDVIPTNERSVNWTDNNLKADQRSLIPQVISKMFGDTK
jgi:hypothetical protein